MNKEQIPCYGVKNKAYSSEGGDKVKYEDNLTETPLYSTPLPQNKVRIITLLNKVI